MAVLSFADEVAQRAAQCAAHPTAQLLRTAPTSREALVCIGGKTVRFSPMIAYRCIGAHERVLSFLALFLSLSGGALRLQLLAGLRSHLF